VLKFAFVKQVLNHIKESLSEADGTGSYSRMMGAIIATATIAWITYIVIVTHTLPNMTDAGVFIASGSSAYAVNKAQSIVSAFKGKDSSASEGADNKGV